MSYAALMWALDQEPEQATDKLVLIALANYVSDRHVNYCFPGQDTLAVFSRCSEDSVQRALKRLAAGGWITIEKRKENSGKHLNARYRLHFKVETTAPNGTKKSHTANCGMDDQPDLLGGSGKAGAGRAPDREHDENNYHTANCGMDGSSHAANHAANHTANHAANCGANLREPKEPKEPLPPSPQRQPLQPKGGREVKWIEELREEGHSVAVLDQLLAPLVSAGLAVWKAPDGARLDPIGPARQICLDMRADTIPVVEHVREAILNRFTHRLPPVSVVRELAAVARTAEERRLSQASRVGEIPPIFVDAAASAKFGAAIRRLAAPEIGQAWFQPCGVIRDGRRVTVVTTHRPNLIELYVASYVAGAVRSCFGDDVEIDYRQGRPVAPPNPKEGAAA